MKSIQLALCAALGVVTVPAFSTYVAAGKPARWDLAYAGNDPLLFNNTTKAIKFWIASETATTANRTAELNALRASFAQWQAVPGTAVKFEELGLTTTNIDITIGDRRNLIFFSKTTTVNGGRDNISSRAGYTVVALDAQNRVVEGDIVLNAVTASWFTDFNSASAGKFVEAIATHEIGHLLGLDHSPLGGASVIDGGPGVGPSTGLSTDDIAAARFLYPATGALTQLGTLTGFVRINGTGISGAMVTAEDARGNAISATTTDSTGKYTLPALPPGAYSVRVSPLDPSTAAANLSLFRDLDIAPDLANTAVTAFKASTNTPATVTANITTTLNFTVASGQPAFRLTQISAPNAFSGNASALRYCVPINLGDSKYVGVSGLNIPADAVLSIAGDGITVGPTIFEANRFSTGANLVQAIVTVSINATPGLRSFVVKRGTDIAYANGYLEIMPQIVDYNFDGFDDRFQRRFFPLWTAAVAGPTADPDNDKFSNTFENLTGTNPTDPLSNNFQIDRVDFAPGSRKVTWKSDIGKKYQLYGKADVAGATWTAVGAQITATTNSTQITDPDNSSVIKFYKLKLVP